MLGSCDPWVTEYVISYDEGPVYTGSIHGVPRWQGGPARHSTSRVRSIPRPGGLSGSSGESERETSSLILPQTFYEHDTITVAKALLECYLVHLEGEKTTLGRIVETEAYLVNDPAAHAFIGKTNRNSVLFGPVGHAYVYVIYGIHSCVNVVTGQEGAGEAVLIRALEPLRGIAVMQHRRKTEKLTRLCNGPARLTEALAIPLSYNGVSLFDGPLQMWSSDSLSSSAPIGDADIVQTTRIGIAKARELPLRFYLKGNGYISRK